MKSNLRAHCKRFLCLLLAGCMTALLAACADQPAQQTGDGQAAAPGDTASGDLDWLEYTADIGYSTPATTLDLDTDVVTPYVEELFKIRVSEVTQNATQQIGFKERLGAMAAAGNLPDVIIAGSENIAYAVSTGKYGDIEEQIEQMDNFNKYMDASFWPRFMIDGKKVQIPQVDINTTQEPYISDPYNIPFNIWSLWTREDILAACGYTFTTQAELKEQYADKGEVPPPEAYAITPAIDTPDALMNYLRQIKDLNLMVNDAPLIPLSGVGWNQFHIGSMFDFGHWRIRDGEVDGFLGSPGAYDYHKWLNQAYQEGLIDAEFVSQKDDQLQQKIATGRVAVGMFAPDINGASKALQDVDPAAAIRYIPWPKQEEYWGKFDIYESGFWRVTVRNDFPEKDRLFQYFDWFYSDEGLDILTWGPEEAGLWEINAEGKKVFVDDEVKEACLNGDTGKRGADYYGLYDWRNTYFSFLSRAAICAPMLKGYNPYAYARSYEPQIEVDVLAKSYFGVAGDDFEGNYSYGDGSDEVGQINNWYWSKWADEKCAAILTAATEEEFDAAWEAAITQFKEETDYDNAKIRMTQWFAENQ